MGRNQVCSATEARLLSAYLASWDKQMRIETMQREGVNFQQIQPTAPVVTVTG